MDLPETSSDEFIAKKVVLQLYTLYLWVLLTGTIALTDTLVNG